ncbi:MAG: tetratricopeptide repeat protein [Myxococcales bacterium]|nr:tetratricopeptide repeat protein [Myxococcales bacterium]
MAGRGDMVRAEQYLSAAMERGYPEDRVVPQLIRVCVASSRISAALSYAEPYLAAHPTQWRLRYLVATLHLGLRRIPEAVADLEAVIGQRPEDPTAHYTLGIILRDHIGDGHGAREHFSRYLELAPEGAHAEEARSAAIAPIEHVVSEAPAQGPGQAASANPASAASEGSAP